MTDRSNEEPLSSEELLRQARGELVRPSTPDALEEPESTPPAAETPAQQAPQPEAPATETTAPTGDEPLIPADFQPAAARGRPAPPTGYEAPPLNPDDGPVTTTEPGLGSKLWAKRGWIVGGVFLAILGISYLSRSTSIEDLSAGDCFNDPGSEAITEVDTVDCTEPHDYEMFASVLLVGNDGSWPGDFELFEEAADACFEAFLDYTGVSFDDEVFIWDYTTFIPEQESWAEGSRDALCTLYQVDAELNPVPATTSARAGG